MVRGGCKATITSNYTQTRLTPSNPTMPGAAGERARRRTSTRTWVRSTRWRWPQDGRVFYAGRAVCFQGQQQFTQWTHPTDRPRLRPDPRLRPARRGLVRPEPVADHQGRRLHGARRQGRRQRDRPDGQDRARHPRHRARPGLQRRGREPNFIYVVYHPYYGGDDGPQHGHEHGPGLRPRRLHGRASPLALHLQRDDQDAQRRADRPPLHDPGLLLLPPRRLDGLRLAGQPVLRHRRQHGQRPELDQRRLHQRATRSTRSRARATPTSTTYEGTGCGVDTSDPDGDGPLPPRTPCAATQTTPTADGRLARRLRLHRLRRRAPDLGQHERVRGQAAAHHAR